MPATFDQPLRIVTADLNDGRVVALLETHYATARAQTAPGSAHALDLSSLRAPDIRLCAAWSGDDLLCIGALRTLSPEHGEIKSMHVAQRARGRSVGSTMLRHLLDVARRRGMRQVSLETGSWAYFEPAPRAVPEPRLRRLRAVRRLRRRSQQRLHDAEPGCHRRRASGLNPPRAPPNSRRPQGAGASATAALSATLRPPRRCRRRPAAPGKLRRPAACRCPRRPRGAAVWRRGRLRRSR